MDSPLLSQHWFRVASLVPRLPASVRVQRLVSRGRTWHVLEAGVGRRGIRIDASAWSFVGRCDGRRSMQALWDLMLAECRDDAPSQDELLALLSRLHSAALLEFDRPTVFARAAGVHAGAARPVETAPARSSIFALRVPLGSPGPLLDRISPWLERLPGRPLLVLWVMAVLAAAVTAVIDRDRLVAMASAWMNSPRLAVLGVAVFVVVKLLHEIGHAVVLRRHRAAVTEWGVTLMMFTPVPYVDGSAASSLPRRGQRFAVSVAGIVVETGLAALALAVVLTVQPGWVRDTAFAVFLIGSVSTLLINGNPLMRFDGYHALTDALDLPNLAPRSTRWWQERMRECLLGVPSERPLEPSPGEAPWLWCYAPASLAWRAGASVAIVVWAGSMSFVLGAMLAVALAWGLAAAPALEVWRFLRGTVLDEVGRGRASRRAGAIAVGAALAIGVVPMPQASVAQGVVWLPDAALVRAQTDGFVHEVLVHDGAVVAPGDPVVRLSSPELEAEILTLESRLDALEADRFGALGSDVARAANVERDIEAARVALERAVERREQLVVTAGVAGRVVVPHAVDLPGRFVRQGALLAHVLDDAPTLVRAAIPQEQATLVQRETRAVSVRLAEDESKPWSGVLESRAAGTVRLLPSAALAERSGGPVATDPEDTKALRPRDGVVIADIRLAHAVDPRVGGRAWVRFDHGYAPLAWQAARQVQQLVLKQFNPAQ